MSTESHVRDASDISGAFGARVRRDVTLRVWAELGRAQLPVGRAAGLGPGSVVELDREVDEPVDVFANGSASAPAAWWSRTASGRCGSSTSR